MTATVKLARLPKSLRGGIERRLPTGHRFKNLTGRKYPRCTVIGFAGYIGPNAAWLCRCQCGTPIVVRASMLEYHNGSTCGCALAQAMQKLRKPRRPPVDIRRLITYDGQTRSLSEWAKRKGITREAMRQRVNRCDEIGIDVAYAITLPARARLPRRMT